MNTLTSKSLIGLVMVVLTTACSRPVAYFQKSQRQSFAIRTDTPAISPAEASNNVVTEPTVDISAVPPAQVVTALSQLDAMVSNDGRLAADKSVQKRMNRVRELLTSATQKPALNTAPHHPQKMNFMQRMMVKKMNKRISKQLAPEHPNKAMANNSILVVGAIAVIVGLVVLLTGSGTIGAIVLLVGAVVLLVGLLS